MLGFIFLETVCAALARDKDEPEEQAETDEGEESLESHYRARHFLLAYHSLVVVDLMSGDSGNFSRFYCHDWGLYAI